MNVENKKSEIHGMGVFAKSLIEQGEWTQIYGMLVPVQTIYGFEDDNGWWEPFPPFRYTNHSDDPNCEVADYDDGTIHIQAIRDIQHGEEITIDYGCDPTEAIPT